MINRYLNTRTRTRDLAEWAGNNLVTDMYPREEKRNGKKGVSKTKYDVATHATRFLCYHNYACYKV